MGTMIYNATIKQMVEVPDDAVEAYLAYPEYSRDDPASDPPAKGKKADTPPADPPATS